MQHLLTLDELRKLGRPIGKMDDDKLEAYLTEAEQMYVKPCLGDELFLSLFGNCEEDRVKLLLDGGVYDDRNGKPHSFLGLKVAISYFVYAQNVMSGDFQSTRYGMRLKEDDYSARISSKERSDHYNNTLEVANCYLNECVAYCKSVGLIATRGNVSASPGGITIRKIG